MDDTQKRIDDLQARHRAATKLRDSLGGQLKAKKEELSRLVAEIKEAGFDPKKIQEERARLRAELEDMITQFEKQLTEVEAALAAFKS